MQLGEIGARNTRASEAAVRTAAIEHGTDVDRDTSKVMREPAVASLVSARWLFCPACMFG